ncbi:hypothetical protein DRO02_05900 [archaeon]|mgnify:CR=1 FL=1|nr:MAG: hypothetical protein DRO02_05900 [archaeon]RLG66466.1 MAG: hypothetical protein DRN89_00845 [archaeon]HDM24251.1 winged helix-turn-helix transcriptional regulator [Candidatus Bathyarchaeota archaeon]
MKRRTLKFVRENLQIEGENLKFEERVLKYDMYREYSIDKKSLEIIRLLSLDGRLSLTKLGEKVNLRHSSVRDRLNKLIKSGLIRVQANISLEKFNFCVALIEAEVLDLRSIRDLIEKLCNCPRVAFYFMEWNYSRFYLLVRARTPDAIKAFVEKNLTRENGVSVKKITFGKILSPEFLPVKIHESSKYTPECESCEMSVKLGVCEGCRGEL